MAVIRPFHAVRYSPRVATQLSDLISPPYDVITRAQREALLQRHPNNVIRLILGDPSTMTPEERDDPRRYEEASKQWNEWRASGVLAEDAEPSIFVVEERFPWQGMELTRIGFLSTLTMEELHKGAVLPHERTLATPIEDRLRLIRATKAHLSPIYATFEDPKEEVRELLRHEMTRPPTESFQNPDQPIHYRLWRVTARQILDKLIHLIAPVPFLIADGHHRYTTAWHYAKGDGTQYPEAAHMLVYAAPAPDPGVVLSAIHREFRTDLSSAQVLAKLSEKCDVRDLPLDWSAFESSGAPFSILNLRNNQQMAVTPRNSKELEVLREVPTVLLNEFLVSPILGLDLTKPADQKRVTYIKQAEEMLMSADPGCLPVWVRSLTFHQVLAIAKAGHVLPQKSTFFYPKIPTGLAFHRIGQTS